MPDETRTERRTSRFHLIALAALTGLAVWLKSPADPPVQAAMVCAGLLVAWQTQGPACAWLAMFALAAADSAVEHRPAELAWLGMFGAVLFLWSVLAEPRRESRGWAAVLIAGGALFACGWVAGGSGAGLDADRLFQAAAGLWAAGGLFGLLLFPFQRAKSWANFAGAFGAWLLAPAAGVGIGLAAGPPEWPGLVRQWPTFDLGTAGSAGWGPPGVNAAVAGVGVLAVLGRVRYDHARGRLPAAWVVLAFAGASVWLAVPLAMRLLGVLLPAAILSGAAGYVWQRLKREPAGE